MYYHGVRHGVHLHDGAVPDDVATFSARNLQHDRPCRINLITADASSGESIRRRERFVSLCDQN